MWDSSHACVSPAISMWAAMMGRGDKRSLRQAETTACMILRFAKLAPWHGPIRSSVRYFSTPVTIPREIPETALVKLPRSLIAVYGFDSAKFLNGLLTIRPPEPSGNTAGIGSYGALLNAKGRVLSDMFVFPAHDNKSIQTAAGTDGHSCYVLDVDSSLTDKLMDTLDFHVLLSDVQIKLLENSAVYTAWNDAGEVDTSQFPSDILWTEDKRAPGLGYRLVGAASSSELETHFPSASVDEYRLRRYLFGVPEGALEMVPAKALPLDSCIDYMGGIDFHKGCYQGQELTIRTHHHGAVRKRVMPVVFTATPDEQIPENVYAPIDYGVETGASIEDESPIPNADMVSPIFDSSPFANSSNKPSGRQRPAGTVIAALGNVGLAKMRIDTLGHDFRIDELSVKPMSPFWWPTDADS